LVYHHETKLKQFHEGKNKPRKFDTLERKNNVALLGGGEKTWR
jgi:hypothetical protein